MSGLNLLARELELAAELGLRTSLHIDADCGTQRPVADLRDHGLLRDTTTFMHANGISDDELRMHRRCRQLPVDQPGRGAQDGVRIADFGPSAGLRPTLSIDNVPSVVDVGALRTRLVDSGNRLATAAGMPLDGTWRPGSSSH